MTDTEINVAIAEACGTLSWSYALPVKTLSCDVPNYSEDLNAMHEAEAALFARDNPILSSPQPSAIYENELIRAVIGEPGFVDGECCLSHGQLVLVAHATVRERNEAFLRTLGKWRDA